MPQPAGTVPRTWPAGLAHSESLRLPAGGLGTPVGQPRRHIATVALEDYFHVTPFEGLIAQDEWYRFESRMEESTRKTLDLLDAHQVRATFFVLGWVADAVPQLVREIARRGHEIASKGYSHRDIRQLSRGEFRDDVVRARDALANATGRRILGYRVPQGWLDRSDLWALEILAEAGMVYDSSVRLVLRSYAEEPWRRFSHVTQVLGRPFLEVPLSSIQVLGLDVPIAGGNYFRQFPDRLMRRAVRWWDRNYAAPYVMYFHTWELDPDQPRINGATLVNRIRQYRNLERMPAMLASYFSQYRFTSIADYFHLDQEPLTPAATLAAVPLARAVPAARDAAEAVRIPVTVVIPCYNEEQSLKYLANTLNSVERRLGDAYSLEIVFVDDASTDATWDTLLKLFGTDPRCRLVRHERNRGVAAAIRTGTEHASHEIVCSMDCDCTYDPHELVGMIPLLTADVDMVTASPYHPRGKVRNVAPWRLFLSKSLSAIYRRVLHQQLATYTSCFRVYRRSAVLPIRLEKSGFLGVAELLGRLDLVGSRIVEYPTCLQVRLLGRSKMKIIPTILGHIAVLALLAKVRLFGRGQRGTARRHTLTPSTE